LRKMFNALSVDVEEYFQATVFNGDSPCEKWDSYESRVHSATEKVLAILARFDTKATFFVVGWVARRHPGLVKAIHKEGHEVACHSYAHQVISKQTPDTFRKDLRFAKSILEDITGEPVRGYRAPTFSITEDTLWALDILIEEGFHYDSSIFPIHHDRYGMPKAERFPNLIRRSNGYKMLEFPMSTLRLMGTNFPFAGGGYMRLLPVSFISRAIERINGRGHPVILYVHPWEFDPHQPRLRAPLMTAFRHYHNIGAMSRKFEYLVSKHEFAPVCEVLEGCPEAISAAVPQAHPDGTRHLAYNRGGRFSRPLQVPSVAKVSRGPV